MTLQQDLLILVLILFRIPACLGFWRMPCRFRTGLARMDPIVFPGQVSPHVHAIHGANNFCLNTTYQDLLASTCTSCGVLQDKSAYWTPPLMFVYPNGTTEVVPETGGMLVYYLLRGQDVRAFPAGFQMVAGDTKRRKFTLPVPDPPKSFWNTSDMTQEALAQKALGFNCLTKDVSKAEPSLYRLRLELMFPSCWNGRDTDSPDHKSHVSYPSLVDDGNCPLNYSVRIPSLFYETFWDTYAYKGIQGQFVLGNGDSTGYGYHGDFMTGWDAGFLQEAIFTCTNLSGRVEDCPLFSLQSDTDAANCSFTVPDILSKEQCSGPRLGLCGNVTIETLGNR